ncbi:MAG: hypothetical protein FD155_1849 [Bacteroidetes bacterium]|nr:MAG: hypothetical protein FD155_1849 [Bacteroidota bacterium]
MHQKEISLVMIHRRRLRKFENRFTSKTSDVQIMQAPEESIFHQKGDRDQ